MTRGERLAWWVWVAVTLGGMALAWTMGADMGRTGRGTPRPRV
jgi:hypothetical protein